MQVLLYEVDLIYMLDSIMLTLKALVAAIAAFTDTRLSAGHGKCRFGWASPKIAWEFHV